MGLLKNLVEGGKLVSQLLPVSLTGAHGGNVNFISIRNYQAVSLIVHTGTLVSTAPALTVNQAKNVEGNGSKAIAFDRYFSSLTTNSPDEESDRWDETTGAAGSITLAADTMYEIPILTDILDVQNDFDCVRAMITAPGTSLVMGLMWYFRGGPEGLTGKIQHIPSTAVNRMPN